MTTNTTSNQEYITIFKYLDNHDDYHDYTDKFKNTTDSFYNILLKIINEDTNNKNISISYLILNIFIYKNDNYIYYFDNKIDKIKNYYYFINVLSIYISELLYEYINSNPLIRYQILKDEKTKEENINIINLKLTEIKITGIYYLLFLFNLLLINNKKLLNIYITFIFNSNRNHNGIDYYNGLLSDFSSNIDEYFNKLKLLNINDINDNQEFYTLVFNILNLNLIYSLVDTKNYDKSLLLTKEEDIKYIYNILKEYLNLFANKQVDSNYNIYSTLSKYLYTFLNL